jgi:WS/DGAT/MGAT family acyltransferase
MLGLDRGDGSLIPSITAGAPATPFNKPVTQHRRVAFQSVDLPAVKQVKDAFGMSVNDVVMAMCAGALQRWLVEHDALPDKPLISMIPVSVRDERSKGAMGNRVSAMLATLPTDVTDPVERLTITHEATKLAKKQQAAIPQGLMDNVTDFAPPALTARAARVAFATGLLHRLPAFNVVVSNVPGPNIPVYLGGARLLAQYPVSVVVDGQGLNITAVGYLDQLHFGIVACRELVPDVDKLADYLAAELDVLVTAARNQGKQLSSVGSASVESA